MVLISRSVPATTTLNPASSEGVAATAANAKASHDQLVGLLEQLQTLFAHSGHIFSDLVNEANLTSQRIQGLSARFDNCTAYLPSVEQYVDQAPAETFIASARASYSANADMSAMLFTKTSNSPAILSTYDTCTAPPNVGLLDEFSDIPCIKKYTNPDFFIEEWLEEQKRLRKQAREERKKRREEKKKEKGKKTRTSKKGQDGEVEVRQLQRTRYDPITGKKIVDSSATVSATPSRAASKKTAKVKTSKGKVEEAPPVVEAPPKKKKKGPAKMVATPKPAPPTIPGAPAAPAPVAPPTIAPVSPPTAPHIPAPVTHAPAAPAPVAPTAPSAPIAPSAPMAPSPTAPSAPVAPPGPAPEVEDAPVVSSLLGQIQKGIALKKVDKTQKKAELPTTSEEVNVAAILARRIAIQVSDSEDSDADSDWDDDDDDWM